MDSFTKYLRDGLRKKIKKSFEKTGIEVSGNQLESIVENALISLAEGMIENVQIGETEIQEPKVFEKEIEVPVIETEPVIKF